MSNFFAFIDETGVLGPSSQRFYGLGLLKLADRLREHLGRDSLACGTCRREASWFEVREVRHQA